MTLHIKLKILVLRNSTRNFHGFHDEKLKITQWIFENLIFQMIFDNDYKNFYTQIIDSMAR